jgi:hypothetical protein
MVIYEVGLDISVLLTTHYKRLFPHTYESGRSGSDRPSQNRERRQYYITQPKPYSPLAPVGLPTLETKDLDNRRFVFASPISSCTAEPACFWTRQMHPMPRIRQCECPPLEVSPPFNHAYCFNGQAVPMLDTKTTSYLGGSLQVQPAP